MEVFFYLYSAFAIFTMGLAMFSPYAIHALLYVIVSLLCVAGAMYSLSAHLAAALEVIVYTGAIMVLFVFAVMLLRLPATGAKEPFKKKNIVIAICVCAVFGSEIFLVLKDGFPKTIAEASSVEEIAVALFNTYGFLVEVISLLLLAGLVAAIFVGRNFMNHRRSIEATDYDST